MSKVVYEVILSPDGKHCVSIKSDDPLSLKDALPLAKKIQQRLLEVEPSPAPKAQAVPQLQTPTCGVHSTPMVLMHGKTGSFWSCHRTNANGSWCSYRPGRTRASAAPLLSY